MVWRGLCQPMQSYYSLIILIERSWNVVVLGECVLNFSDDPRTVSLSRPGSYFGGYRRSMRQLLPPELGFRFTKGEGIPQKHMRSPKKGALFVPMAINHLVSQPKRQDVYGFG